MDYFVVSPSLMAAVSSLIIMTVLEQRLESDHSPLKLMLNLQAEQSRSAGKLPEVAKPEDQVEMQKIRYRADKVQLEPVISVSNPALLFCHSSTRVHCSSCYC